MSEKPDSPFKEVKTERTLSDLKVELLRGELNKSEDYNIYKKDTVESKAIDNEDTIVISLSTKLKNKLDKRDNNV